MKNRNSFWREQGACSYSLTAHIKRGNWGNSAHLAHPDGDNGGYLSIYLYSRQLWNEKYKIELSCHRYGYGHFQENCYPCPYDYAQFVLLQKNRLDEV